MGKASIRIGSPFRDILQCEYQRKCLMFGVQMITKSPIHLYSHHGIWYISISPLPYVELNHQKLLLLRAGSSILLVVMRCYEMLWVLWVPVSHQPSPSFTIHPSSMEGNRGSLADLPRSPAQLAARLIILEVSEVWEKMLPEPSDLVLPWKPGTSQKITSWA